MHIHIYTRMQTYSLYISFFLFLAIIHFHPTGINRITRLQSGNDCDLD